MTAEEFKRGLKEFVAPELIVSDNTKPFQATKKWLWTLRKHEDLFNYFATKGIEWKFNLSRAPWWLLDVESLMNNQPLRYLGEGFEQPVITPNLLLRGQPAYFLENGDDACDDLEGMTRRMRYLKRCRDNVRKRWSN